MGMDLDLIKTYGDDLRVRNTLADYIEEWKELQTLRQEIKDGEEAAVAAYREANKSKIERVLDLTEMEQNWLKALNTYVEEMVIETGRKQFFDRLVTAQVRKRAGEYKVGELTTWAKERRFMDLFTVPKKPSELLLKHLREHDERVFELLEDNPENKPIEPIYLELDEKVAVSQAIATTSTGARMFPKAPVPLETYVTNVSMDTLHKLLYQLAVEVDIEEKATKRDNPEA